MKTNEFAFYRKRIRQTQEKIADILGIPLDIYIEMRTTNERFPNGLAMPFIDY